MDKSLQIKITLTILLLFFLNFSLYAQVDAAPSITAEGKQAYCLGIPVKIVTDFTITDSDDTGIETFFIQISGGYQAGFDRLELGMAFSNITESWDENEGKLTLTAADGTEILLTELESAVMEVVFISTSDTIIPEKTFSLTIDNANYLPLTDHFYEFVAAQGINWSDAKTDAENRTYFGRQGYLATLTSQEESDFAGKQASGAGWIGGSDEENEGEWKWVTGPEVGTVFWNGQVNGTTPNFAFWNNNEPNDFRGNNTTGEDYAHITDPSIGIRGAWNDLPNAGGTGLYIAKGYIVEYGIPSDSPLNIVASTSIYIPQIESTTDATICESGIATITAMPSEGTILWYDDIIGGNLLFTGTDYTTEVLNSSTFFYATVSLNGCTSLPRTAILVNVNQRPVITDTRDNLICSGSALLSADASEGDIFWFETVTSTVPLFVGASFQTPILTETTSYYVEANNADCTSISRTEVTAVVDSTIPRFDVLQDIFVLCEDVGSVDLETENPDGDYSYVWKKDNNILQGDLSSITVMSSGFYSVSAISEAGCESTEQFITVSNSEKATITKEDVIITDDSTNNSIQVANPNLGSGEYEFALDNEFGTYIDEGFFQELSTGLHTLYIRDKGGFGTEKFIFSVLGFPKFFTPNEDGENDIWEISGFDTTFYSVSEISIYNRFGNLMYSFDKNSLGWDGNLQGKRAPSTTYWFRVMLTDMNGSTIEKTGNFSLIRK